MNDEKRKQNLRLICVWCGVLLTLAALLIFPKEVRNGGSNGGYLCIQVLLPSLFPFTVLSDFVSRFGIMSRIPKFLGTLTEKAFALPKEAAAVIIMSLVGGYPVGAKSIRTLFENGSISEDEAKRLSLFCVSSGPGFLLTYLGGVMLGSLKTGYILLLSQCIALLTLGICTRFMRKNNTVTQKKAAAPALLWGDCLVVSVYESVRTMANMCGFVILFSSLAEIYLSLTASSGFPKSATALLEITTGCKVLAENPSPVAIAFFTGFGGICVHLQIFSILKGIRISKIEFMIFRLAQGLLCGLFTFVLIKLFPSAKEVFSTAECVSLDSKAGMAGCFLLILCSGIFLLVIGKKAAPIKHQHQFRR